VSKTQIAWQVRRRLNDLVIDDSAMDPADVAIYTLSDPRDVRLVRYVGQTSCPQRRYLQHVAQSKLWMPDEVAWWVKSTKLRPLYEWIRELYREEFRLPVMMVVAWTEQSTALVEERRHIQECLVERLPLFNREGECMTYALV
jgi:hypothetical protein